jgi:hypothetical protein
VKRLLDGRLPAGRHEARWDGRDARNQRVASGVYYLRIEAGGRSETRKIAKIN